VSSLVRLDPAKFPQVCQAALLPPEALLKLLHSVRECRTRWVSWVVACMRWSSKHSAHAKVDQGTSTPRTSQNAWQSAPQHQHSLYHHSAHFCDCLLCWAPAVGTPSFSWSWNGSWQHLIQMPLQLHHLQHSQLQGVQQHVPACLHPLLQQGHNINCRMPSEGGAVMQAPPPKRLPCLPSAPQPSLTSQTTCRPSSSVTVQLPSTPAGPPLQSGRTPR
jgi:hypothetical protein